MVSIIICFLDIGVPLFVLVAIKLQSVLDVAIPFLDDRIDPNIAVIVHLLVPRLLMARLFVISGFGD